MPMLIPESLLQKEKDHIAGFAPEVAWVTMGGDEKLTERLCIRPTSETLFCEHFANIVQSYRDLPLLYNQWCSVVRWEKSTRPFLRHREFLWQEGHTAHATAEEATEEAMNMQKIYADFCENYLAMPVVWGRKTESDKFAGAKTTFTLESLMHDGKALQAGTTHDLGDRFAKTFGIQYTDANNKLHYVHQASWGVTSRLIGAVIMVHGDNNGLVLPPKAAPVQVVIIPIASHKEGVLDKARELKAQIEKGFRVKLDDSDRSPGWKFSEYEMKGVPLRVEAGPKDIEAGQVVLVRRDNREKIVTPVGELEAAVADQLADIQRAIFARALANRESRTDTAHSVAEMKEKLDARPGFIKAMWCGDIACENAVKEQATATSRCMPFAQENVGGECFVCGGAAAKMVVWGRAY
jgi:prolyl-tRNA synthetase